MPLTDFTSWIGDVFSAEYIVFAKRLSANDTLKNNTHQAGPYIPKPVAFSIFPELETNQLENPRENLRLYIDSHMHESSPNLIYYNSKIRNTGTRDEARLTGLGGRSSILLDPDSTDRIALFAFNPSDRTCRVWLIENENEEEYFSQECDSILPRFYTRAHGQWSLLWMQGGVPQPSLLSGPSDCYLDSSEILPEWYKKIPAGSVISKMAKERRKLRSMSADIRIQERFECEEEIFNSIQNAHFGHKVRGPFNSVEEFLALAKSITNSRVSRAGNALEYQVREILLEDGLIEGKDFVFKPKIEEGKEPDFLFPTREKYEDFNFPEKNLKMLAVKTSCKDRWRQVLNEADRISVKHLLTLETEISVRQFNEMSKAGIKLIIPERLHTECRDSIRPHLMTFEGFIAEIRGIAG